MLEALFAAMLHHAAPVCSVDRGAIDGAQKTHVTVSSVAGADSFVYSGKMTDAKLDVLFPECQFRREGYDNDDTGTGTQSVNWTVGGEYQYR